MQHVYLGSHCPLQLVLFDMDDVLLNTELISKYGWQIYYATLVEEGIITPKSESPVTIATWLEFHGVPPQRKAELGTRIFGDQELYRQGAEIRKNVINQTIATFGFSQMQGVSQMLAFLDRREIRKCVVTASPSDEARLKITNSGLVNCFDRVFGGEEMRTKLDGYTQAAEQMSVPLTDVLIVEDSPTVVVELLDSEAHVAAIPSLEAETVFLAQHGAKPWPDNFFGFYKSLDELRQKLEAKMR